MNGPTFLGMLLLAVPNQAAEEGQDFLLLAENAPVVLRLHLLVDGEPAAVLRARYLDRLFADLDRDGDGFLSKTEAERAPSVTFLQSFLTGGTGVEAKDNVAPFEQLDTDRDGRVSRREFDAYYLRTGLEHVRLTVAPSDQAAERLTDVLFQLLDRDGDGKLSRTELKQAAEALRSADFNDDEWITPDELLLVDKQERKTPPTVAPLLIERNSDAWSTAVRKRYPNFDEKQWTTLWQRPPDLELRIRLTTRRSARVKEEQPPRAEVFNPTRRAMPLEKAVRALPGGDLRLSAGNLELDVLAADGPESSVHSLHQFIRQQFQAADADGKGSLTRRQAEDSEVLAGLFVLADRDGDGRLSEQELNAFLDLHGLGAVSFTTVTLADQSRGLFDLLDADSDGRLSLRELATAWEHLREYDRDGDGLVTRAELPRRFQLHLIQGKAGPLPPPGRRAQPRPTSSRGPEWFRKMDRNGDGYVSRREWLGPEDLFRRLDVDGDGLISPEEAEALEKPAKTEKRNP